MTETLLIADYMTPSPHSIGVSLSIADAKNLMRAYKIRHLPVLDGGALVGVVSDRDIQLIESMNQVEPEEVSIEEAMTQIPFTVTATTPVEVAARHMYKHKLGSAVVMDGIKVIGVFTTTDALRALTEVLASPSGRPARLEKAIVKAPSTALVVTEKTPRPTRASLKKKPRTPRELSR